MRRYILLIAGLVMAHPVAADPDGERAALARLIHELDALAPIIADAEAQSDPDARIRFEYPWLRDDLLLIKLGVREHQTDSRQQPRRFPPLKGDYRSR